MNPYSRMGCCFLVELQKLILLNVPIKNTIVWGVFFDNLVYYTTRVQLCTTWADECDFLILGFLNQSKYIQKCTQHTTFAAYALHTGPFLQLNLGFVSYLYKKDTKLQARRWFVVRGDW